MYNYYKIEEQHVEEVSKFLSEKEIPFVNLDNPTRFTCENIVNNMIERCQDEDMKPLFRKVEEQLISHMTDNFDTNIVMQAGHNSLFSDAINNLSEGSSENE